MRRRLTGPAVYLLALSVAQLANAQASAGGGQSLGDWFFGGVGGLDWHSLIAAALMSLVGGVVRTMRTLRRLEPTLRVALETFGDACLSLMSGMVVYLLLGLYQLKAPPPPHLVSFALLLAAGYMRGGPIDTVDSTIKRVMATASDGVVAWVAAKASAAAAKAGQGAKPLPPADPPTGGTTP